MTKPVADPVLTVEDVAAELRTPPGTLRYWRHVKQGPESFKIGRRVVYYRSAVDRYLAEQHEKTSSARESA